LIFPDDPTIHHYRSPKYRLHPYQSAVLNALSRMKNQLLSRLNEEDE
jgi:hypothetical protein